MEDTDMKRQKIKNKNFNYFKRRFYYERILQASCLGASIGFVAAAIGGRASHKWWVALICGILSFIASATFLSWRWKPSDKQVARHLDKTLHLQEKVATRVELKDQDGVIINKQRENAAQVLSQCEAPRRRWWQIVITPLVLSIAFFIASYFMSRFSLDHGDNIIPPATPTVEVIAPPNFNEALEDIENKISEDLEDNIENRDDVISQGKEDIDDLVNKVNSKEEIGDELMKSNDDALKALGEAIKNGDLDKITEAFNQLQQEFENLQGQELADKLHQIANEIRKALENSKIPEDDPLRKALNDLADNLDKAANYIAADLNDDSSKCTVNSEKESAKESLKKAEEEVKDAVDQQNKNQEAGEQAKDDLDNLGKGSDDSNKPSTGGTNGGNNNNGIQPGKGTGGGSGEINYAGNDHVFTDEGDTTYGDVIDNSNGAAQDDCDHYGDGNINAAIDDYFKDLYGNNNP